MSTDFFFLERTIFIVEFEYQVGDPVMIEGHADGTYIFGGW